ncbi:hypothetical protein IC006_0202 [Sulfuracidifex tepidarius]|nr:hypothetical protein IC006_0202 [Sulfuracidifex tepidarius]
MVKGAKVLSEGVVHSPSVLCKTKVLHFIDIKLDSKTFKVTTTIKEIF